MPVAFAIVVISLSVPAYDAEWRFRCDGTDPYFLKEIDEAFQNGVGFGETWDETVCDDGALVLGDGYRARKRPKPLSPEEQAAEQAADAEAAVLAAEAAEQPPAPTQPELTALERKMRDQFFAIFIPLFTFGVFAVSIFIAAIVIALIRTRKQYVVDVSCPSCPTHVPFVVGDDPLLFCPACGAAYRVDAHVSGGTAVAATVPL